MPTPSLLIVPARFKTGKLYSQIPVPVAPSTSSVGDFTVTRNTTATRFNSAGLIESVASGIPRLDYYASGGVTGCPALLVEPAATNLCPRSQEIDLWSPTAATTTPNAAISPNGTQNAELFVPNSGSNGRTEINVGTLTNATTYTMTCFMKQHTASLDQITLYVSDGGGATGGNRWGVNVSLSAFTLSNYTQGNGSVTSTSIENYGNGWYRIRVTGQVTSGMTSTSVVVIRYFGSTANGTNGVLVFGAQFELGSVPTSYIPTTAGTGSRSADVISVSGAVSGSIGQTEGTFYFDFQASPSGNVANWFNINNGTANNWIFIGKADNKCRAYIRANNVVIFDDSSFILTGSSIKAALGYKSGDYALYINGNIIASGTTAFTFSTGLTSINSGAQTPAASEGISRYRAVALYTTRLTNAELASLTAP